MAILIGNTGVVYHELEGNPRAVRYWAERGLIHREDSKTGGYSSLTVTTFLERLRAINDMMSGGKTKENEKFVSRQELARTMKFVEQGVDLARKAKEQGDPDEPDARRAAKRALPTTVVVPAGLRFGSTFDGGF